MAQFRFTVVLSAVDKLTAPFRSLSGQTKEVAREASVARRRLSELARERSLIETFKRHKLAAVEARRSWKDAEERVKALARQMKEAATPSRALSREFAQAKESAGRLKDAFQKSETRLQGTRKALEESGISTRNLAQRMREGAQEAQKLNAELEKQKEKLALLKAREESLSRARGVRDQMLASAGDLSLAGASAIGVGRGVMHSLRAPVQAAVGFEAAMSQVSAMLGEVGKDSLSSLALRARELGRATEFTAPEVATAMRNLAQAGFSSREILVSLPGLLNMAKAGMLDLASATSFAADTASMFELGAVGVSRVADVMVYAANASNMNIQEMAESLKYAGTQAQTAGLSIEETASMIGILANVGLKGSMAGTTLSNMLLRLSGPTGGARKKLKSLGVEAEDAKGNLRNLTDILSEFERKTSRMGSARRLALFKEIFSEQPVAGALKLMQMAARGEIQRMRRAAEAAVGSSPETGAAARGARIMADNAQGDLLKLQSAVEDLKISLGNLLIPTLRELVKVLSPVLVRAEGFMRRNPEQTKGILILAASLGGLTVAAGLLFQTLAVGLGTFALAKSALIMLGVSGSSLVGILTGLATRVVPLVLGALSTLRLGLIMNPVGAVIGGIALAATLVVANWKHVQAFFLRLWEPVKPYWEGFLGWVRGVLKAISNLWARAFEGGAARKLEIPSLVHPQVLGIPQQSLLEPRGSFQMAQVTRNEPAWSIHAPVTIHAGQNLDESEIARRVERAIQDAGRALEARRRARLYD